jgi:hypothetical protein
MISVACNQGSKDDATINVTDTTIVSSTLANINEAQHTVAKFEIDGKLCFATINQYFKDYKHKDRFPYSLWVTVETLQRNTNGHPTNDEAEVFNNLEDSLIKSFAESIPFCYIGRTTRDGYREVMIYVSDKQKATEVMNRFIDANSFKRKIKYEIDLDKEWKSIEGLYGRETL